MKLQRVLWSLGMVALLVGFAGLLSAETSLEPVLEIDPADEAPVCQEAVETPGVGDLVNLEQPVLLGSCSGELCGCFTPSCPEECPGLERACLSACRQEQKQCAIACCSP